MVILETNVYGDVTGRNVYGLNLLVRIVGVDTFYYMYNGHADVTALLTPSGDVAASYYYDAFGNILEQTGDVSNSVLFAGYQYDKETGLYYLNARMYDPVTARFMQEDTYVGQQRDPLSLNLYTYCHNSPLLYWDPTGHSDEYVTKSVGYYDYHGTYLSLDPANDSSEEAALRAQMLQEYPGRAPSNPAELAMINAGAGGDTFKFPPKVYKTIWINKETKEIVSYEEVQKSQKADTPSEEYLAYEEEINARIDAGENVQKQEWIQPSGWELPYEPDKWNDYDDLGKTGIQYCTNCYGYAMNFYKNPVTGEYHTIDRETQPAYLLYKYKSDELRKTPVEELDYLKPLDFSKKTQSTERIITRVAKDMEIAGISFKPIEKHEQCEEGGYKVALVLSNGDYHWYRQNPDGTW